MTPLVIGLAGPIGAGKSTAALHLVTKHGFVRLPFAGPLKDMLRTLLRGQGAAPELVEAMVDGDAKERPSALLGGETPRRAMQTLGTEWGRALHRDLWIEAWTRAARCHARVVADDVRFTNEVRAVHGLGGLVLGLTRAGTAPSVAGHVSEAGVACDRLIANDGAVTRLQNEINRILADPADLIRA